MPTTNVTLHNAPFLTKQRALVDRLLVGQIGKDLFELPTFVDIDNAGEGVADYFDDWYQRTLPLKGTNGTIKRTVRIYQSLALQGAFYAYNAEIDSFDLYTADPDLLSGIDGGQNFDPGKITAENSENIIHCMRLDVKYLNVTGDYSVKATKLTAKRKLKAYSTVFVPYIVVERLLMLLRKQFKAGRVYEMYVQRGKELKKSIVSLNPDVLSHYNGIDGGGFGDDIVDFHLNGRVYLPAVGAPSTTLGLTYMTLDGLDYLAPVRAGELEIEIPDNSTRALIRSEMFNIFVDQTFHAFNNGKPGPRQKLRTLLRAYGNEVQPNADRYEYYRAIRDLPIDLKDDLWGRVSESFKRYAERMETVITGFKKVDAPRSGLELRDMLKSGVYRMITVSSEGKFSMMYVTNNYDILEKAYGSNYFASYESEGSRRARFRYLISDGVSPEIAMERAGVRGLFDEEVTPYQAAQEVMHENNDDDNFDYNSVPVTTRVLFYSKSLGGGGFYRRIYPDKIYSMAQLNV